MSGDAGWNPHLPRATKSTEKDVCAKHLTRTCLHRVESLAKGGRRNFKSSTLLPEIATESNVWQSPGVSRLGSSTLDSSLCLIYDPRGETKFPCPPHTAQTNENDALFIIAGAKPEAKAEVWCYKKKKKVNEGMAGGGGLFSSSLHSLTPSLTPSIILARKKGHGSEIGNESGWRWEAVPSL